MLKPVVVHSETDMVAAATRQGRLLIFPVTEIPVLSRGKGNKLIQIPAKDLVSGSDQVVAVASIPEGGVLKVISGKRHVTFKASDIESYIGARARRGSPLPRGFQRVDGLEID